MTSGTSLVRLVCVQALSVQSTSMSEYAVRFQKEVSTFTYWQWAKRYRVPIWLTFDRFVQLRYGLFSHKFTEAEHVNKYNIPSGTKHHKNHSRRPGRDVVVADVTYVPLLLLITRFSFWRRTGKVMKFRPDFNGLQIEGLKKVRFSESQNKILKL